MQDLLTTLVWKNAQIPEAAAQLCTELPGWEEAQAEYLSTAEEIQEAVGYSLFNKFETQLFRYTEYEVRAYYALGLGLRETMVRELCLEKG